MTLDELQKLCDEATAGPWEKLCLFGSRDLPTSISDGKGMTIEIGEFSEFKHADLDFIAAARTYMPKLIAVARAAKKIRDSDKDTSDLMRLMLIGNVEQALADLEK